MSERESKIIEYTTGGVLIHQFDKSMANPLQQCTSFWNPMSHKREEFTGYYIEELKTFCTHWQNPKWLQSQLPDYQIIYDKFNDYDFIDDFSINGTLTLTDFQFNMLKEMGETTKNRIFLNMPTGTGKTILSVFSAVNFYKCKTIIMCFNKKVLNQWWKTFEKHSSINMGNVVLMDSRRMLDAIYENDYPEKEIYLCTPGLLDGYGLRYGYEKLNTIMKNMKVGLMIYDEAHRRIKSMVRIDAFTNVRYRLYLSGDYNQTDSKKRELYYRMFSSAQVLSPSKEVIDELKFLKCCIVYYTTQPDEYIMKELRVPRSAFINKFKLSDYEFRAKMAYHEILYHIMDQINKTNKTNSKTIICSLKVNNVDDLYDRLMIKYPNKKVVKNHRKAEASDEELAEADIIIATYQSFSTGRDIDDIAYAISLDLIDEIELNQFAGRIRPREDGKECWLFMLADYGFEFTSKKLKKLTDYLNLKKIKEFHTINYSKKK